MAFRDRIRSWLGVDQRIRALLRQELASRAFPQASEVQTLRERLDAMEKQLEKIEKKQKMVVGTVQAAGAEHARLHDAVESLHSTVAKANQRADAALRTAESVADGLESLEERLVATPPTTPTA